MSSEVIRHVLTKIRSEITVAEALDLWLAVAGRIGLNGTEPVLPTTLRKYRQVARDYIRPFFEGMTLRQVTAPVVARYRAQLLVTYSRPLAVRALTHLRSCLEACRLQGLIAVNPATDIRIATPSRQATPAAVPSREQAGRLLIAADALARVSDPRRRRARARNRAAVYVLRFTGMRIGEVLGLPWSAIDTWNHRIAVRQIVNSLGEIADPKTRASHRTLEVPPPLTRLLLDWQRDCPRSPAGLVFPAGCGKPWLPSNFASSAWARLSETARLVTPEGRSAFTRHSFRHLYAAELIDNGATISEVRAILGHARATTTLIYYGHLFHDAESASRRRRMIERIADENWPR